MACRVCGQDGAGIPFEDWVRKTFTDWDKLQPGNIICFDCLFWFNEQSDELAEKVGKDKPQRMRNYSHFIVNGEWIPLSKGDKVRMQELLLGYPFPELAIIAASGQKHIAFRAVNNPELASAGWVQFEEQSLYVQPNELGPLLDTIEELYSTFAKYEIESGDYKQYRIIDFGMERWVKLEAKLMPRRGSLLFILALFLAQKKGRKSGRKKEAGATGAGSGTAMDSVARDTGGLQESVSRKHLESVRGSGDECGVHEQAGQVRQLGLFES